MSAQPPRLVVVDDEPEVCATLARMLARLYPQYLVESCPGSAEALAVLAVGSVSCVITDYRLAGPDTGIVLARTIRTQWPTVPVILISGFMTSAIATEALAAGCVAVIDKPVTFATLRATIEPLL